MKIMKSMIKKSALALIAALPLFTACQDEPELGSLLHPEEVQSTCPKVYINELAAPTNTASASVIQTPVSMLLENDEFELYVHINQPVDKDVTVTVAEDTEEAAAYGNNYEALPAGTLTMETAKVTIPAGKTVSSEPVKFKIAGSESLKNIASKGVAALSISSTASDAEVAIAGDHNTYYVLVNKKVTNFKDTNKETLASKTQISADEVTMTFDDQDVTNDLMDGSKETMVYMYDGPGVITCKFNEAQPVAGLSFVYGYSMYYGPYEIDILTSDDNVNWTSQTGGTLEVGTSRNTVCINFYAPVTCKYVRFEAKSCYYGLYYGDDYNTPCVGDLYLYK